MEQSAPEGARGNRLSLHGWSQHFDMKSLYSCRVQEEFQKMSSEITQELTSQMGRYASSYLTPMMRC